ncbi:MAG: thioredoxin-like domain-containing protein, partial [Rhodothermales bacterium]
MPGRIACLLALILVAGNDPARAQTAISGQLLGARGEVMPAAHVEVYPYFGRRQVFRLITAKNGRYRVEVDHTGLVRLRFHGPLHRTHEVVVLVEDQPSISLDVQLQQAWLDPDQSFTRVATSYTNFDYNEGVPLEEQADGSYTAVVEVPGDSLVYTLPGVTSQSYKGLVIESITADRFKYSRREGYLAVVAGPEGEVEVTLRPKRLETQEAPPPVVTFGPANGRAAALSDFYKRLFDFGRYRFTRVIRAGQWSPSSAVDKDRENAFRQEMLALEIEIEREADPFRQDLLLMLYLHRSSNLPFWMGNSGVYRNRSAFQFGSFLELQREFVARIIDEIPPTSIAWTVIPALLQVLIEESGVSQEAVAYVEQAVEEHPVAEVRRFALYNLLDGLYARRGLSPEVAGYMERYGGVFSGEGLTFELPLQQDLKATVGRRAPGFGRTPWERRNAVSSDSLKGQVVLLDFWAPWCDECVADLEILRKTRETHDAEGFQIVRVSLDYDVPPEQNADELPWLVYQGEDGFKSRIARSYEVLTLPHRVLID